MDREKMIEVAKKAMYFQDIGDPDSQMKLYAQDCTFMMPHLKQPLRGLDQLFGNASDWPKSTTEAEWFVAEDNRLVMGWNWRGEGWPPETPLNRGMSLFVFNDDGLIQEYEDFFDPDWATRHSEKVAETAA